MLPVLNKFVEVIIRLDIRKQKGEFNRKFTFKNNWYLQNLSESVKFFIKYVGEEGGVYFHV